MTATTWGLRETGRGLGLAALATLSIAVPAHADTFCDESDPAVPCRLVNGTYHVRAPEGPGPFPAVVALHSSGETGADLIASDFYAEELVAKGFVLIAPNGAPQPYADGTTAPGWHLRQTSTGGRDDISFIERAIAGAATRFPIDRDRVLVTGYGLGASMTWEMACLAPDAATAFAPRNGGFYTSLPGRCRGPFRLMHVHAQTEDAWPLTGEAEAAPGAAPQPIQATMELASQALECTDSGAMAAELPEGHDGLAWTGCAEGADLALVLHKDGNYTTAEMLDVILSWFAPGGADPAETAGTAPGDDASGTVAGGDGDAAAAGEGSDSEPN